jgi:hypothetical protein
MCPISVLCSKFIPGNIKHMHPKGTSCGAPADKFFAPLDLDQLYLFLEERNKENPRDPAPFSKRTHAALTFKKILALSIIGADLIQ